MKRYQVVLPLMLFFLFSSQFAYGILFPCGMPNLRTGKNTFKRTYLANLEKGFNYKVSTQPTQRKGLKSPYNNARSSSSSVPVFISTQDFASHLNVGNQRHYQYIEEAGGGYTISMDIGSIDEFGTAAQDWHLPDFSTFSPLGSITVNHIAVNGAYGYKDFPDATHAAMTSDGSNVEFYQLSEVDLYFLGFSENIGTPQVATYDYDQTLSPAPLDFNFGLQTTVVIEYEGNPELDSVKYVQDYDVIGFGTLHTADDGSHEALKMIFTEKAYTYLNGTADSTQYSEIVWYSKEGHHVRAGIDDPWNSEGVQDLLYIQYQRLTNVVPLAPENLTASAQSAGSILLNWEDKSVNESSFEIIRSKSAAESTDGSFSTIDATFTAPANATTFTDNTANSGTTYFYKVRAKKN